MSDALCYSTFRATSRPQSDSFLTWNLLALATSLTVQRTLKITLIRTQYTEMRQTKYLHTYRSYAWYFVDRTSQYSLFFFISNSIHYSLPSTYSICYPLSSTCFRPHRLIIRRSKLYMQPVVLSSSADVFVVRPLSSYSTVARQRHLQRGRIP